MTQIQNAWQMIITKLTEGFELFLALTPRVLGTILILLLGWFVAKFVRKTIQRLARDSRRVMTSLGVDTAIGDYVPTWSFARIVAELMFWVILALSLILSLHNLGLPGLANWLTDLFHYLPQLLLSVFIIFIGIVVARSVKDMLLDIATRKRIEQAALLATSAQALIITFALLVSFAQIGVDVSLLVYLVLIVLAALLGCVTISFGVGAKNVVSNILSAHYLQQDYTIGQRVRVQDYEGTIVEMTATGVWIDTDAGRALIPSHYFQQHVSEIIDDNA